MILLTCPDCGEEYPPQVTNWVCPTCGVDDYEKKMIVFDLRDEDGDN